MTFLRRLAATILVVTLIGCGSDDSTSPPHSDPPLASADIGPEGGVVDGGEISVEIPAGAINETATVQIHRLDDDPVGSAQPVYAVSGLPANRDAAFTVSVAAEANLVAALGEPIWSPSNGDVRWAWRRWPAASADDRLEIEVPRNDLPGDKADDLDNDEIRITTMAGDGELASPNDQFVINYDPADVTFAQAADVAGKFELALATYTNRGWAYPGPNRVVVELRNFGDTDVYGYWSASKLGDAYCCFEINSQHLGDTVNLMATIGHETLHMVQHYYDPRWCFFKAISGGPQYWFDEATAVWAEELFLGEDHVPDVRVDMEHFPLAGLPPNTDSDSWTPQDYGYGMSAFIKEVVARNGGSESQIIACYEELLDENVDTPMEAIMAHVTGLDDWYDDFLVAYVGGGPYDDYTATVASFGFSGSERAEPGTPVDETLSSSYRDRQGRLYRVQFATGTWDPSASLVVSARGESDERQVPVTIYRRVPSDEGPDRLDMMATGDGSTSYLRFGNTIEAGTELFILVIATVGESIDTRIRVSELEDPGDITVGGLSNLSFTAEWADGSTTEEDLGFYSVEGEFTGDSFSASWDHSLGSGRTGVGQFHLTFDPISLDIETWWIQETRFESDGSPYMTITASGGHVARDPYEPGTLYYSSATRYVMEECSYWRSDLGSAVAWEGSSFTSFVVLLH